MNTSHGPLTVEGRAHGFRRNVFCHHILHTFAEMNKISFSFHHRCAQDTPLAFTVSLLCELWNSELMRAARGGWTSPETWMVPLGGPMRCWGVSL